MISWFADVFTTTSLRRRPYVGALYCRCIIPSTSWRRGVALNDRRCCERRV
ncbi:hypothetical protein HMPREF1861_01410 [Corynebacterium kroppenstedtii]|nr:hypothetical protein HMPREF1861_01410 [Corynebacterium kroppenstedtii]